MGHSTNILHSLIQGTRRIDPTLADILTLMNDELHRVATIVDPKPTSAVPLPDQDEERPGDITVFDYIFTGTNIILFWEAPSPGLLMYEIRKNSSSFSDGDHVVTVAALSIILDPNDSAGNTGNHGAIGNHVYTIKAFNQDGEDSANEAILTLVVPPLGTITVSPNVINNQVILTWTEPSSSFNISHYRIFKDGNLIQDHVRGTFFVIQEIAGGVYQYGVRAVDIAGNISALATVTLDVNDPTDYEVQSDFLSAFTGTKINCIVEVVNGVTTLLACVNVTETYENHFLSRFWNTPQQQINAGFPRFIQPAAATGSYKEVIDFGTNFTNNILSYNWQFEMVEPSVSISVSTRHSTDGIAWSSPIAGTQIFLAGPLRYIEVTLSFISS